MSTDSLIVVNSGLDFGEPDLANVLPFAKKEDISAPTDSDSGDEPETTESLEGKILFLDPHDIDFLSAILSRNQPHSSNNEGWKSLLMDIFSSQTPSNHVAGYSRFVIEQLTDILRKYEPELSAWHPSWPTSTVTGDHSNHQSENEE